MIDFNQEPQLNLDDEVFSGAVTVLDAPISSEADPTVDECMEIDSRDVLGYVAVEVDEDEETSISPEESLPPLQDGTQPLTTQDAESVAYLTKEQEKMLHANKNLAYYLAGKYRGSTKPHEFEDICQIAMIGLMNAIKRFDPEKGEFAAFASRTIEGKIRIYFRDSTWPVHIPRSGREYYLAVNKAVRGGVDSSDLKTLSSVTGLSHEQVRIGLEACECRRPRPIDAVNSDGDRNVQVRSPIDLYVDTDDTIVLRDAMQSLCPKFQKVLKLHLQGYKQQEIADKVGFSQMHVSRLIRKALDELRVRLQDSGAYND